MKYKANTVPKNTGIPGFCKNTVPYRTGMKFLIPLGPELCVETNLVKLFPKQNCCQNEIVARMKLLPK